MRSVIPMSQRFLKVQLVAAVLAMSVAGGCSQAKSEGTADGASGTDTVSGSDVATGDVPGHDTIAVDTKKIDVKNLSPDIKINVMGDIQDSLVQAQLIQPQDCTSSAPCPLVFVVGDYDTPLLPTFTEPAKKLAASAHVIVLLANMPGTGDGAQHSTGKNDYGALWHTSTILQLFKTQSLAAGVDKTKVGFLTIGTGIVPVAGAFYAYPSDLASAFFVIDVEGPVDRCSMSQAPEDDAKNVGPGDGAGSTDSACHFSTAPHSAQYPPAKDGKPASIVCAPGAWPITQTGSGCDDNSWWVDREPYAKLQKIGARYQRIQFKYDHRLPSHWASRLAMKSMASSQANFFALNDMPPCTTVSDDDCVTLEAGGQLCWLAGAYGNGLPPAPYAGADFQPISWDALFTEVMPTYVGAIIDTKTYPKCK
jgi:hypothetical protein